MSAQTPAPAGAASGPSDQVQRFRDASEQVRQRTERTAKGIGGLGTAGVSAIGIAKFADLFPWPPGQWLWAVILIASFFAMILMVGVFSYRLWGVSQPLVTKSDSAQMEITSDEKIEVDKVYDQTAHLAWAPSLRAMEARAHRLERVSARLEASSDERRSALAARLKSQAIETVTAVRSSQASAALVVIRRRSSCAVRGPGAIAAYVVFAVAVFGFGVAADRLDSERNQRTDVVKKCAEAAKAVKAVPHQSLPSLPPICKS
jgi:hypothetical protein